MIPLTLRSLLAMPSPLEWRCASDTRVSIIFTSFLFFNYRGTVLFSFQMSLDLYCVGPASSHHQKKKNPLRIVVNLM